MTSCDTNILYAALDSRSVHHDRARAFLDGMRNAADFAICELVLVELYGLLRNPAVSRTPCSAAEAAALVTRFRTHPRWQTLDYPGPQSGVMRDFWNRVAAPSFPYRRIYDLRLALTLRHGGIRAFATRNTKDFQGLGFDRVWDPLA